MSRRTKEIFTNEIIGTPIADHSCNQEKIGLEIRGERKLGISGSLAKRTARIEAKRLRRLQRSFTIEQARFNLESGQGTVEDIVQLIENKGLRGELVLKLGAGQLVPVRRK